MNSFDDIKSRVRASNLESVAKSIAKKCGQADRLKTEMCDSQADPMYILSRYCLPITEAGRIGFYLSQEAKRGANPFLLLANPAKYSKSLEADMEACSEIYGSLPSFVGAVVFYVGPKIYVYSDVNVFDLLSPSELCFVHIRMYSKVRVIMELSKFIEALKLNQGDESE
jgi:hypothetical protein